MILDLRPLVSGESEILEFDAPVELDLPITKHMASGKGTIRRSAGALSMIADCCFTVDTLCARCLTPIDRKMKVTISHYLTDKLTGDDSEGYIEVNYKNFDVSELLREDMILSMPSRFLCKPECRGLCPVCGTNLNTGTCEHADR